MNDRGTVFTIGHSTHGFDAFVGLLRGHGIAAVADVRSRPYSRLAHFCEGPLRAGLKAVGLEYVFLGRELGARREEPECYVDGQADYDRIARLPAFEAGLDRLQHWGARHVTAILCAEKDPLDCHRMVLVGRALTGRGWSVGHILADGELESQAEAQRRLQRKMGVERTLFEPDLSDEDLIERAYAARGKQIGYRGVQGGTTG